MHAHVLTNERQERRFMLVFRDGESITDALLAFAREEGIEGATLSAVGGVREATLAYWDPETKKYEPHAFHEQMEVASLLGSLALNPEGSDVVLHAHAVLGTRDASARAGHFLRGIVHPTLEMALVETNMALHRHKDEATGLAMLR